MLIMFQGTALSVVVDPGEPAAMDQLTSGGLVWSTLQTLQVSVRFAFRPQKRSVVFCHCYQLTVKKVEDIKKESPLFDLLTVIPKAERSPVVC